MTTRGNRTHMSNDYLNRAWYNSQSSGTTKLVLLALADQANDDGYCWPGVSSIARRVKISARSVQRHTSALEEMKEIKKITRTRDNGSNTSNGYIITLPPYIAPNKQEAVYTMGEGDRNDTPPGDRNDTPPVTDMTPPEPSLKPQIINPNNDEEEGKNPFQLWESITGLMSQFTSNQIGELVDDWDMWRKGYDDNYVHRNTPATTVVSWAMEITGTNAQRPNLKYVKRVLENWKANGIPSEDKTEQIEWDNITTEEIDIWQTNK